MESVRDGYRLPRPPAMPVDVYNEVVFPSWATDVTDPTAERGVSVDSGNSRFQQRPTFAELRGILQRLCNVHQDQEGICDGVEESIMDCGSVTTLRNSRHGPFRTQHRSIESMVPYAVSGPLQAPRLDDAGRRVNCSSGAKFVGDGGGDGQTVQVNPRVTIAELAEAGYRIYISQDDEQPESLHAGALGTNQRNRLLTLSSLPESTETSFDSQPPSPLVSPNRILSNERDGVQRAEQNDFGQHFARHTAPRVLLEARPSITSRVEPYSQIVVAPTSGAPAGGSRRVTAV